MSAERIAQLRQQIAGWQSELLSIGFPANVALETQEDIDRSNAAQTIISNRMQKLLIAIQTAQHDLRELTGDQDVQAIGDDVALLHIVSRMGRMSEADKMTQGRTSMRAWRALCREAAAGTI